MTTSYTYDEELLSKIIDGIKSLIEQEDLPNQISVGLDANQIENDSEITEVCYYILCIQDLLCLSKRIEDGDVNSVVSQLRALLNDSATTDNDVLTETLGRIELAHSALEEYHYKLEEGIEPAGATEAWKSYFERIDNDALSLDSHELIDAKVEVRPPNFFIDAATEGRLLLSPPYQRDDVWDIKKSQRLIESILRKIPLPSIILDEQIDGELQVVDGKQRLTSLLRFTGNHPEAQRKAKELDSQFDAGGQFSELLRKDYPEFRKLWKKHHNGAFPNKEEERLHKLPFTLPTATSSTSLLKDEQLGGKYYTQIRDNKLNNWTIPKRTVSQVLEGGLDYNFPVITFTTASVETIREVFRLYNVQGQTLNAEEIRNAEFNDLEIMRAMTIAVGDAVAPEGVTGLRYLQTPLIAVLPTQMKETNVGTAAYKRSKIASWILTILFQPGEGSTAAMATGLFKTIARGNNPSTPFRQQEVLLEIFEEMSAAFMLVNERNWPQGFKSQKNSLGAVPLVTVVAALMAAKIYLGGAFEGRFSDDVFERIADKAANEWKWPGKMQTNIQWQYTSLRFCGILEELGIDLNDLHKVLESRFATSGILTRIESASIQ